MIFSIAGTEVFRSFRTGLVCLLILAAAAGRVLALDPTNPFSSYMRTNFDGEYVPSVVDNIVQSRDGFLWLAGSNNPLTRFDGRRFVQLSSRPNVLAVGPDGDLWIGLSDSLERVPAAALSQFGRLPSTSYRVGPGLSSHVICLHFSRGGVLFVGTEGGLYRFERGTFSTVIRGLTIDRMEETANGHLLVNTSQGFLEWDGTKAEAHPELAAQLGVSADKIFHVFEDSHGVTWFCTASGVARRVGGVIEKLPPYGPTGNETTRAYEDPQGTLWFASSKGLLRATSARLELAAPGLSVRAMYGDRDGNLWIGANGAGLIRFRDRAVRMFTTEDGLPNNVIMTVLVSHNGTIWTGANCGGLSWFDGRRFRTYSEKDGLLNSCVWALAEDAHHDLWIGTYNGGLFRFHEGAFTHYSSEQGLANTKVTGILPAKDGSLWLATHGAVTRMRNDEVRNYTKADGLSSNLAFNVVQDGRGVIWVGTNRGLDRLDGDRFVNLPSVPKGAVWPIGKDRLGPIYVELIPAEAEDGGTFRIENNQAVRVTSDISPTGIAETQQGDLWLTGNALFRLPPAGLRRTLALDEPLDYAPFGAGDGMASAQTSVGNPNSAVSPDGKLWVATQQGLAMLDLPRLPKMDRKPQIYMEEITVGRNQRSPGAELVLPPDTHHVELQFDTIELSSPEKIRLQYRLDGVDSEWLDVKPPGHATYSNIPSGKHPFHVRSCNRDGIWDRAGMVYNITRQPYFYETAMFWPGAGLLGFLLVAGLYRWRLSQATGQLNARLQVRLGERERIARELHDTLLQGFQGLTLHFQAVLEQIPAQEPARQGMKKALSYADQVLIEGRERVRDLRAEGATANDLSEELVSYGELIRDREVAFTVTVLGEPQSLHPVVSDEIYRIAREALANAFRHSQASKIEVEITYDAEKCSVRVRDNGSGIGPNILSSGKQGHWGLAGMQERAKNIAAHLNILSNPGCGTEVDLTIPAKVAYAKNPKPRPWFWSKRNTSGGR